MIDKTYMYTWFTHGNKFRKQYTYQYTGTFQTCILFSANKRLNQFQSETA